MIARPLVVIAFVLACLLLSSRPSVACSCAYEPTKVAEVADVVFTGVARAYGATFPVERSIAVEFQVETVYKGLVGPRIQVQAIGGDGPSGGLGPGCEYGFQLGRRYTVFAIDHDRDGLTNTNGCFWNVEGPISPATYGLSAGQAPSRSDEVVRLAIVAAFALAIVGALSKLAARFRGTL
jgi:hypothetical protein